MTQRALAVIMLLGLLAPAQALDASQVLTEARRASHIAEWQTSRIDTVLDGAAQFEGVDESYRLTVSPGGQFLETLTGRLSRTTGFDGSTAWQTDHAGVPRVLDGQDRETALLIAWVLTGRWAAPGSSLFVSLLPDQTNDAQAALSLRFPVGTLATRLLVDRHTWLPATLTYTTQTGEQTWQFTDFRPEAGLVLPHRWTHRDNDLTDTLTIRAARTVVHAERLYAPVTARPDDSAWDAAAPAQIAVKRTRVGDLLVHPLVDGKDIGWFLLDTGTNTMGIDPKVADAFHLPRFGAKSEAGAGTLLHSAFRPAHTLQIGPLTLSAPLFEEFDVGSIVVYSDVPIAGICGYDLFARAVVELDMDGGTVALFKPANYQLKTGAWQLLSLDNRVPSVRCPFEGDREGLFGLDTGFTGSVIFFTPAVEKFGLMPSQTKGTRISGFGGGFAARRGRLAWFEIGGRRFPDLPITLSEATRGDFSSTAFAGYVGQRLLGAFTVVFDYSNRRAAFVRHQTR